MKNTILTLSLFVASIAVSQSNEFQAYELDTKESIYACKIVAYTENIELETGYIEKINGSIISMQIAKNTDYLILINDTKYFKIYGSIEGDFTTFPIVALVNDPAQIYPIQ